MKIKPSIWWVIVLAIVGLFSIPLARLVEAGLIQPIVKFFWILKGYYGSIHQLIFWGLALLGVIIIAGMSLKAGSLQLRIRRARMEKLPGEVGQLAFWIRRRGHGPYPRWYLARVLGDLAIDILRGRGASAERGGRLSGPGWDPPGEIQPYLETAVRTTPATFSRQLESAGVKGDPETESIVGYLESYSENTNDN
jgi:hypothetical protein